jgi:hypothetical protein
MTQPSVAIPKCPVFLDKGSNLGIAQAMEPNEEGGTAQLENMAVSAEEYRVAGQFSKARQIQEAALAGWLP